MDKNFAFAGAGAGTGIIWSIVSKQYIDTQFGKIPYIGDMLPDNWGYWSTGGSIIIGGVLVALSQFTNIITNDTLKWFTGMFGVTALIGGAMNGLLYNPLVPPPPARARMSMTSRRAGGLRLSRNILQKPAPIRMNGTAQPTPTGISYRKILS